LLRFFRAYANRELLLALGFSSALHAAVLSSLEARLPGFGSAPKPALSVRLKEQMSAPRAVPVGGPHGPGARPSAVLAVRYLPLHEVDTPARPRGMVPLVYPEEPLVWKLAGVVRLRLLINEQGAVDAAEIISAQPEGEFEQAALDAVRRLVYDPALRNGRPVKSEKRIEVTFDPYEAPAR
jgi:periplasmic protein TonB